MPRRDRPASAAASRAIDDDANPRRGRPPMCPPGLRRRSDPVRDVAPHPADLEIQ
jgi:hypothetical protein